MSRRAETDRMQHPLEVYLDSHTPTASPPQPTSVIRSARSRRRGRRARVLGVIAATVAIATVPFALGDDAPEPADRAPSASGADDPAREPGSGGAVRMAEPAGCIGSYSPEAMAGNAAFAFAGTVEAFEATEPSNSLPSGELVPVRFQVSEWIVGRGGESVTVALGTPADSAAGAGYRVGTRLLVSGDRFSGTPSYIAWGCGFTRYFDSETANEWTSVARGAGGS